MPTVEAQNKPSEESGEEGPDRAQELSASVIGLVKYTLHAIVDQFRLLHILFSNWDMRLAAPVFLVSTFRGVSLRVLTQYTSNRFGWELDQVRALHATFLVLTVGSRIDKRLD